MTRTFEHFEDLEHFLEEWTSWRGDEYDIGGIVTLLRACLRNVSGMAIQGDLDDMFDRFTDRERTQLQWLTAAATGDPPQDDAEPAMNEALARFAGGTARLWGFTASPDRLTIELRDAAQHGRKHLVLLGCSDVRLPSWWRVQRLHVEPDGAGFILRDDAVAVRFDSAWQLTDPDADVGSRATRGDEPS